MLPHLSRHRSDPEQSASFLARFLVCWLMQKHDIHHKRKTCDCLCHWKVWTLHLWATRDCTKWPSPISWTSWRRSRRLQLDSSWQVHVCHWWAVTRISIPYEQTSRSPRVICRHLRAYPLATAWASGKQLQDRRITRRNRSMSEMLKSADSCAIDSLSNNRRGR